MLNSVIVPPALEETFAIYIEDSISIIVSSRLVLVAVVMVCCGALDSSPSSVLNWVSGSVTTSPVSFSSGSGAGETISIYFGVKINIKDIKKKASRVFLSMFK